MTAPGRRARPAGKRRGTEHPATGSGAPGPRQGGSAELSIRGSRKTAPACDPHLPASFRRWALRQRPCLDTQGNLVALLPGGSSRGARPAAICCWLLAAACMILLFTDPLSAGRGGWLAAVVAAAISAVTIQHRSSHRDLRLCRSKVVFPENLDATCQALLGRAQSAISSILGSRVRAAGLLGNLVDGTLLDQHEWEIACQLREITSLRALLAANTPGSSAGPMTTDVLRAQQRAIEVAQEATASRVLALERYASQVIAADDADRDWQLATTLSHLNDKYLDLVARTAADDYAAGEIAGLTEQLTAAARARNDRLRDADLAARALVLPQTRPIPGRQEAESRPASDRTRATSANTPPPPVTEPSTGASEIRARRA